MSALDGLRTLCSVLESVYSPCGTKYTVSKTMYNSAFDDSTNLLTVRYTGQVDTKQTRRCAKECESAVQELRPGFRLLTDLSGLEQMDLDCVPDIKRMMDLCDKAGVELVVRVIPDPHKDIGFNILSLFHYRKRVRIVTCKSLEEAEKILLR